MQHFVVNGAESPRSSNELFAPFSLWAVSLALFMAATGAMDTEATAWSARLLYWSLAVTVGATATLFTRHWWPPVIRPWPVVVSARVAVLVIPSTLFALALCIGMFGGEWSTARLIALAPTVAAMLFVLQLPLVFGSIMAGDAKIAGEVTMACGESGAHPNIVRDELPFAEHLPPKMRGAVLHAIEAQDHYVRLHTSRGRTMLRMRFTEAVVAAQPIAGVQTHRSWWVADAGIEEVRKESGRRVILLKCGERVPVSRSRKDLWDGLHKHRH